MSEDATAPSPRAARVHHIRVQRTARYFVLGGGDAPPRAIWFVLHGYGQLAGEFVRYCGDLANDATLVVAPEALNRFYLVSHHDTPARDRPVGATWMTREERDSEIADYVEFLDSVFDEVASDAARQGAQINVLGFSQGAATATRWIAHGRARVHRLVLWGGLIPPDSDLSKGPQSLCGVPLTIVAGLGDHYVDDTALAAERARLQAAGIPFRLIQYDGGHALRRSVFPQLTGEAVSGAAGR